MMLKNYCVNIFINDEYFDCLEVFGGDTFEDNQLAKDQAEEYALEYQGDQDWFNDFTDYEFTHEDDTWGIVVEEINA